MPGTAIASPFKDCFEIHLVLNDVEIQRALNGVEMMEHELRGFIGIALRNRIRNGGVLVGAAADACQPMYDCRLDQAARFENIASLIHRWLRHKPAFLRIKLHDLLRMTRVPVAHWNP
jgi:hypothetical protein